MTRDEQIAALKQFRDEHPEETGPGSVVDAVIWYLEHDDIEGAQYKVMLDTDKLANKKLCLRFFDSIGLIDPEYRARLVRWGTLA